MLDLIKTSFLIILFLIPVCAIIYYTIIFEKKVYKIIKSNFVFARGITTSFLSILIYLFLVGFFFLETRKELLDDIFYISIIWVLLNYIVKYKERRNNEKL